METTPDVTAPRAPGHPAWHGTGVWASLTVGAGVLAISLIHVGPTVAVLNHFDPPKLLLWGFLGLAMALGWLRKAARIDGVSGLAMALLFWMVARTVARPRWDVEWEVLVGWTLPVLFFLLARGLSLRPRVLGAFLLVAGATQAALMVLQRCGHDPLFAATTAGLAYAPARMIGTVGYQNQAVDLLALSAAGVLLCVRRPAVRLLLLLALLAIVALTAVRLGLAALALAIPCALLIPDGRRAGDTGTVTGDDRSDSPCRPRDPASLPARAPRARWLPLLCVVLAVAATVALIPETRTRVLALVKPGQPEASLGSRALMGRIAVRMWSERPLAGWGGGEYAFQYIDRLGAVIPAEKTHAILRNVVFAREAHNDYLQFGAEFGWIGVALLGAVAVSVARRALRNGLTPGYPAALAYGVVYMGVAGLASFPWQTSGAGPLAGLLLGALTAPAGGRPSGSAGRPTRREALAGVMGRGLVLVWATVCCLWAGLAWGLNRGVLLDLPPDSLVRLATLLPPGTARFEAVLGARLAEQGDPGRATALLEQALQGYRDGVMYGNLGFAQAHSGEWRKAADTYARWARTGLNHRAALGSLSTACENAGETAAAVAALESQLRLWPEPVAREATVRRLASLRLQAGDAAGALQAVLAHERGRVLSAELDNLAGAALVRLARPEAAAERFRAALAKKPDLASARRNLEALGGGSGARAEPGRAAGETH